MRNNTAAFVIKQSARLLLCILLLAVFLFPVSADNSQTTVYVTNTGTKYHREGCSYLSSKHAVTLQWAVDHGYERCSRCGPPILYYDSEKDDDPYTASAQSRPSSSGGSSSGSTHDSLNRTTYSASEYAAVKKELDEAKTDLKNAEDSLKETQEKLSETNKILMSTHKTIAELTEENELLYNEIDVLHDRENRANAVTAVVIVLSIALFATPAIYVFYTYRPFGTYKDRLRSLEKKCRDLESEKKTIEGEKQKLLEENRSLEEKCENLEKISRRHIAQEIQNYIDERVSPEITIGEDGLPRYKDASGYGRSFTAYRSQNGRKYHLTYGCSGATTKLHICQAMQQNLSPCRICGIRTFTDLEWYYMIRAFIHEDGSEDLSALDNAPFSKRPLKLR